MSTGIGFKKALVTVPGLTLGDRPFVHSGCVHLYIEVASICTSKVPPIEHPSRSARNTSRRKIR